MTYESQRRAIKKYTKKKGKQFNLKFYPPDTDLWEHLQKQENKAGYIKALMRRDMQEGQK